MQMIITREMRRQLERDNAKQPPHLVVVPADQWPDTSWMSVQPCAVWRSRFFLVQEFNDLDHVGNPVKRLSVARTTMGADGRWLADVSWDELQEIKRQIGLGGMYAIEVYPRDGDIVNVANMRHLWVLPAPLAIGWFKP